MQPYLTILTPEKVRAYIDGEATNCPRCGTQYLSTAIPLQADRIEAWAGVVCAECHLRFTEIYQLVALSLPDGVTTVEAGPPTADDAFDEFICRLSEGATAHAKAAHFADEATDLYVFLLAACSLLTPAQRVAFRHHPEVLEIIQDVPAYAAAVQAPASTPAN